MMRPFAHLTLLLLTLPCLAQQVSMRDLSASWRAPDDHIPPPSLDECPNPTHGISQQELGKPPLSPDGLQLTVVRVAEPRVVIGEEFTATVNLKNAGTAPVRIPWQSDGEKVVHISPDGTEEKYEVADVNFRLRTGTKQPTPMPLQSEGALFAYPENADTYLELKPGQWVEMKVKGMVFCALEECPGDLVPDEHATLTAWWYQRVLAHRVKACNDDHSSQPIRQLESAPFPVVVHAAPAAR